MNEIDKVSQDIYGEIRQSIIHVQRKVQQTVNAGMVQIYWESVSSWIRLVMGSRRSTEKEFCNKFSLS